MTQKNIQLFKRLFSDYCHQEINKNHCNDSMCDFCVINAAYEKIFNHLDDDEYEEDNNY